jgi:diguanylate cyclase (GGDEF)-like protein
MRRRVHGYLHRLSTPGELSPTGVLIACIIAMTAVFAADMLYPGEIRLHVLYLFPLTALGLHCERLGVLIGGIVLATAFQLANHYYHGLSDAASTTDAILAFSTVLMTVTLSRTLRQRYLATEKLASNDMLTGLNNRHNFEFILDMEIQRQERYGGVFSLAVIDLNHFKALNDARGHYFGDMALKLVGEILHKETRQSDATARLGGDEFAVLMPNTGEAHANIACTELAAKIVEKMIEAGFPVTASIGFATFDEPPESPSVAVHKADKAMYVEKMRGRKHTD